MSEPKIPKGWRKLRKGTVLTNEDKAFFKGEGFDYTNCAGEEVGNWACDCEPYIRRVTKSGGKRK